MPPGGSNKLLTPDELAERLSLPRQQIINRWRALGFKAIKVGQYLRFRERDVETWLAAHEKS
jgi:excisionase family DNA binding protein